MVCDFSISNNTELVYFVSRHQLYNCGVWGWWEIKIDVGGVSNTFCSTCDIELLGEGCKNMPKIAVVSGVITVKSFVFEAM